MRRCRPSCSFSSSPAVTSCSSSPAARLVLPAATALPLVGAILATQALAVLMCGFGWLIPAIPWTTIAWVWGYNLVWLLVLGAVRVAAERLLDDRTARRQRSLAIVGAPISRRRLLRGEVMDYRKRFAVEPGSRVKLKAIDPAFHGKHADEASAEADLAREVSRLTALQYRLYAEKKHACLIVLQGIDAAGKDGTVWHVMTALNPQGTTVTGFKQPTELEHDHDFLWRVHPHAPRSARSPSSTARTTRTCWWCACTTSSRRRSGPSDMTRSTPSRAPRRQRHHHRQVLPLHLPEEQLARFKARLDDPSRRVEDQRHRLQGARLLGRLRQGLRGDARALLDRARAVVRDPVEPQVVSQLRGLAHPRRHARRPEDEDAEADGRHRRDPQGIPRCGRQERVTAHLDGQGASRQRRS